MKPQALLNHFLPLAHQDKWDLFNQVFLDASATDSYSPHDTPSLVNWAIGFLRDLAATIWFFLAAVMCFLVSFLPKTLYQCNTFSDWLHHSKLETWLLSVLPSLWFTQGLFSGFGIYVRATSLWIDSSLVIQGRHKVTLRYFQHKKEFKKNPSWSYFGWLQAIPSSVTAYLPGYQGISRIITKLKNRYILKSWKNKMHLLFTQKCIQDFFDRNSILLIA